MFSIWEKGGYIRRKDPGIRDPRSEIQDPKIRAEEEREEKRGGLKAKNSFCTHPALLLLHE
jgi:hypothetical protein